jgi:large subunit ribosomal protein L1
MAKHGKRYREARAKVEDRKHTVEEAVAAVRSSAFAKFDETVELALLLGVNPKHADQMVRGTVVLPHGTGRTKRVLVIAGGEKVREASEAGADHALTGPEAATKIQEEGWMEFDAVIATPDAMKDVGKLGRILGPRGLMPNPKAGTVTFEVAKAVQEVKAGRVEFRVDKTAIIHVSVGKLSFDDTKLAENIRALAAAVIKLRPAAAKGRYVQTAHIASTMGPGVEIEAANLEVSA